MVAVDNNDLVPMPFTRDCLEYLMQDAAVKPAVMTGWDMSSMTYFRDQLLKIPSVGAVCEYGMLFRNGEKIVNLYPSSEKEALDFLSVAIDLCAADGLKFAVQGNYSTAVGPLVVEADKNGNLLRSLSAKTIDALFADGTISGGMLPKISSALDAARNGVKSVHVVDGRVPHCLLLEILTDRGVGTMISSD